jgi:acyl-CoA synthetase (AMP-forming)/AMP-acid ligase II
MTTHDVLITDTVDELIRRQASLNPDRIGLEFEGRKYPYAEMNARANKAANAFLSLGVVEGDRIAWIARNVAQFWDALFGAIKIGAVLTPVNWRLAPPEIAQIIEDSSAKILIGEEMFISALRSVDGFTFPATHLVDSDKDNSFDVLCESQSDDEPPARGKPDPEDVVLQLYTSGTTGLPKGVLLTHRCYAASAVAGAEMDLIVPQSNDETALHALPHFHVAGVNFGLMAVARSMPILQLRQFDPGAIVDAAQGNAPLNSFFVPAMIMMILHAAKEKKAPLNKFVCVSYGAAPMPEPLLDAAMAAMPDARWTQFYGATETTGGLTWLSHEDHAPGLKQRVSAGKPYPGSEARIIDPATGDEVGQGETGEILTKSRFLMKGYWNREDATSDVLKDGWYSTGDAGYRDENGYIYVVDRIKDMIISGGENIYPAELEIALSDHPGIAEVAVIGVPDEKWGEAVKVCAVCRGEPALDEAGVLDFLSGKIANFKMPRYVEFIDALPRNPSGKVLKTELRKRHSG